MERDIRDVHNVFSSVLVFKVWNVTYVTFMMVFSSVLVFKVWNVTYVTFMFFFLLFWNLRCGT